VKSVATRKKTRMALITMMSDIYVRGPRKLALYAELHGFEVTLVFLPMHVTYTGLGPACVSEIPKTVVDDLIELTKDCHVIGYSAMTDYMPMVRQIGQHFRKIFPDKIQLLGGVHSIQAPEYAIKEPYIDGICTGEGELPTLNFLMAVEEGKPYHETRGFHFRMPNGEVKINCAGDYVDLDALPFVDLKAGYIALKDRIEPINEEHLKMFFGTTFWTDRSRGCPFKCAYCIHSRLAEEKNNPVRWNSMEYFVAETRYVLDQYPWMNCIYFNDETFTVQSIDKMKEFSRVYRETIGLPYSTYVDPFSATPEKMDLMYEAGLNKLKMGVQSGSKRIMSEYFDRMPNYMKIVELTRHIGKKWGHKTSLPIYDLITGIPWATKEDMEENFRNVAKFGTPFFCQVFTLAHYPGSGLFQKAVEDKIVDPENLPQQNHLATEPTLGNSLLQLIGIVRLPDSLIEFVIRKGWAASTRKVPWLFSFTNKLGILRRIAKQVRHRDPTLFPDHVVRALSRVGFFRTRQNYEQREGARAEFLRNFKPVIRKHDEAILIDMRNRTSTLGNFDPRVRTEIQKKA
jgi:anaerobic magnesium-protoporphyrin IX monomethyl ester cyclase